MNTHYLVIEEENGPGWASTSCNCPIGEDHDEHGYIHEEN